MAASHLVSVAPASAELFRAELRQSESADMGEWLDEHHLTCRLDDGFQSLFWLHRFPIGRIFEPPELALGTIEALPWDELPINRLEHKASFGIQLSAGHRLSWSFSDLVESLLDRLGLERENFQPRSPQVVLSAYFHQQDGRHRVFAGVSEVSENLSVWSSGQCRMPRESQAVSRAEAKLLEALETFGLQGHLQPGSLAVDLGAAPGGWTRILAGKGYRVHSVDPAELDPAVLKLPLVQYHAETAGRFFAHGKTRYDLMVSDMKMEAGKAADLLVKYASRLKPKGRLLTTLKLGKGLGGLKEARQALQRLSSAYSVIDARQLYFNRSEITVHAEPKKG